ncbi:MAG: hypothetical protein KatS3mg033_0113 [Thermonema sp.]|uniref:hypothetical protein n=1 Tax=Thermonema sp. TaxID=2231181 RepID=UPI0021DF295C|nr:hypothetical protein [Thermonema sp.]GIV38313.1 MAG: hypothetical protein KatS3mg033_0113 [Thermonema sp.]
MADIVLHCRFLIGGLLLWIATFPFAHAQENVSFTVSGTYKGRNIYVQNPFTPDRSRYCTRAVYVNDQQVLVEPRASSFEVDLSSVPMNSPVIIKIVHTQGCKPKIINPDAIRGDADFQFVSYSVDENTLHWTTAGETENSTYYIQKLVNNNWLTVRIITARGSNGEGSYTVPVQHHTGVNRYRIRHQERDGRVYYSPELIYRKSAEEVRFYPKNASTKIYFTQSVPYKITDVKGNVLLQGNGKFVDISKLPRGVYVVHFGNKTDRFLKK